MNGPIYKDQLQSRQIQTNYEQHRYNVALEGYLTKLVDAISREVIETLPVLKRFFYRFGKLLGEPHFPPELTKRASNYYKNDYAKVYPVKEIIGALQQKFPDCKVYLDPSETSIVIDWS